MSVLIGSNPKIKITSSLEDYLETMLSLKERNNEIRVTDVALELNISKPSVNKAMNILKKQGLLDQEHYGLISLTEKGEEMAKNVLKRHVAVKQLLNSVLLVDEETAEKEACLIEHAISEDTLKKLIVFLEKYTSDNK